MKCGICKQHLPDKPQFCDACGAPLSMPAKINEEARAQVLATLIQSQDSITWVAFSLSMTIESVLLVAFVQEGTARTGREIAATAGAFLAVVFGLIVHRSNTDMSNLYNRAVSSYPETFHFPKGWRSRVRARQVMLLAQLGWFLAWIYLIHLATGTSLG